MLVARGGRAVVSGRLGTRGGLGGKLVLCGLPGRLYRGQYDGRDLLERVAHARTVGEVELQLARAGALAQHGIKLLIEPINTLDIPGFFLSGTEQAVQLIADVGSPNLFIQYDIYHMQIMEGDVIRTLTANAAYIGHYHTAGNPGRNEFEAQDQQELNYPAIMRAIKSTGFKGFVGQEFLPKRDALTSLREAVKLCNV